jgi:hypothetical protein
LKLRTCRSPWLVAIVLSLTLSASASDAQQASPAATENPALQRFNRAITFYLGFNHGMVAELARGKAEPTKTDDGEQRFHPGLYGRAMMLVGQGTSTLWYSALDNVDFTKPGSVAAWTCPQNWVRSENEDYFFPVTIMSNGAKLMFGRQGRQKSGRTDINYAWAKIGDSKEILIGGGDSLQWKNGEWHLWVMNWRSNSVEFSIDGGPLNRQDMPVSFNPDGDRAGHIIVGAQMESNRYLIDEVIVFNRPLAAEEIKWIYEEGMKRAKP